MLSLSLQIQTEFHGANDEFNFLQKDVRDALQEGPSLKLFKFEWSFEARMTVQLFSALRDNTGGVNTHTHTLLPSQLAHSHTLLAWLCCAFTLTFVLLQ